MYNVEDAVKLALESGFDRASPLDCSTITLHSEVRDTCKKNTCGKYGKSWSCPPGCGTLEECWQRVQRYSEGIIVQTIGELEDEFDGEGMMEAAAAQSSRFRELTPKLRKLFPEMLAIGTGSCSTCSECTYPDAPCRFPEGASSPMEALGMIVSEVCAANGVQYYNGKGTITYTACFLLK